MGDRKQPTPVPPIPESAMNAHFELLGYPVRDIVTGFTGVVTSVSFDLYGCVQAIVSPGLNEKGEPGDGRWFDMKRLIATANSPVMQVPTFEAVPGGQDLPAYPSMPVR